MESKLKKKGTPPPRYDEAFKAGAVRMVTEQRREPKEVARDLGICIDILRSWLKASGMEMGQVSRHNRDKQRIRELEAELRSLRKQLGEKGGVIDILKKIRRHPVQTIEEKYRCVHTLHRQGTPVEQACGALEVSRSGYYGWVSTNPVGGNRAIRRFGGDWWSCTRSTPLGLDPPSHVEAGIWMFPQAGSPTVAACRDRLCEMPGLQSHHQLPTQLPSCTEPSATKVLFRPAKSSLGERYYLHSHRRGLALSVHR